MECQMDSTYIPQCPHLKPNESSQDFQDITLEGDFLLLDADLELTRTQSADSQILDETQESYDIGKRSIHEIYSSRKYTFQSCIDKVEKRPQKRIHR